MPIAYRVSGTYIAHHQNATYDGKTTTWRQRIPVDEIVVYPDTDEAINIACRRVATQSIDFNTFVGDDVAELQVQRATPDEIEAHERRVALLQMETHAAPLFDFSEFMIGKLDGNQTIAIMNIQLGATDAQLATIAQALSQEPANFH